MAERNYDYRRNGTGDGRGGRNERRPKIVLAIVIIIVAWKILKGISAWVGIALAGLVVYGG